MAVITSQTLKLVFEGCLGWGFFFAGGRGGQPHRSFTPLSFQMPHGDFHSLVTTNSKCFAALTHERDENMFGIFIFHSVCGVHMRLVTPFLHVKVLRAFL